MSKNSNKNNISNKARNTVYNILKYTPITLETEKNPLDNLPDDILHQYILQKRSVKDISALINDKYIARLFQAKNVDGFTPLHLAINNNLDDIASYLISLSRDLKGQDNNGQTVLHLALNKNNLKIANELINKKTEADAIDKYHNEIDRYYEHNYDQYKPTTLTKTISRFEVQDKAGNTPLHIAVNKNFDDDASKLIELSFGINCQNDRGCTALHLAAKKGNLTLISLLIKTDMQKAFVFELYMSDNLFIELLRDLFDRNESCNSSPLLVYNYSFNIQDKAGNTPLHLAINKNFDDVASYLIPIYQNLAIQNKKGQTPLHLAIKNKNLKITNILITTATPIEEMPFNQRALVHKLQSDKGFEKPTLKNFSSYCNPSKKSLIFEKRINTKDFKGNAPLHLAVKFGDINLINDLLNKGANYLIRNNKNECAIDLALKSNNNDIIKAFDQHRYLIFTFFNATANHPIFSLTDDEDRNTFMDFVNSGCCNLGYRNEKGDSILNELIKLKKYDLANFLIDHNASSVLWGDKKNKILYELLQEISFDKTNYILKDLIFKLINKAIGIYFQNEQNPTLLHFILDCRPNLSELEIEIAVAIINTGLDVNIKDKDENTPLNNACKKNEIAIVKYLVNYEANLNIQDKEGKTPIFYASQNNYTEIVKYLFDNGANLNIQDKEEKTPIFYASQNNYTEIVKYLLDNGANLNIQDKEEKTPIFYASQNNYTEIVKYLLDNGANLNIQDKEGNSPLLLVIKNGSLDLAKFLIDNGANPYIKNKVGDNALTLAAKHIDDSIVKALYNLGVSPNLSMFTSSDIEANPYSKYMYELIDDFFSGKLTSKPLINAVKGICSFAKASDTLIAGYIGHCGHDLSKEMLDKFKFDKFEFLKVRSFCKDFANSVACKAYPIDEEASEKICKMQLNKQLQLKQMFDTLIVPDINLEHLLYDADPVAPNIEPFLSGKVEEQ